MYYLKRNTKFSILPFLVLILFITISISTLAKTEVYFSLCENPQTLSTTSAKPKDKTININSASQDQLIKMLKISKPLAQKIIAFPFMSFPRTRESIISREELGGFKDPQDFLQLPELTNLEWQKWKEQGIIVTVN